MLPTTMKMNSCYLNSNFSTQLLTGTCPERTNTWFEIENDSANTESSGKNKEEDVQGGGTMRFGQKLRVGFRNVTRSCGRRERMWGQSRDKHLWDRPLETDGYGAIDRVWRNKSLSDPDYSSKNLLRLKKRIQHFVITILQRSNIHKLKELAAIILKWQINTTICFIVFFV